MKKILIISAILAISIQVFAQTKQVAHYTQHSKLNELQTAGARLDAAALKTNGQYSPENSKNDVRHKTLQRLSSNDLIQVMDSIYSWQWNTSSLEWDKGTKYLNFYDASNNVISQIAKSWDGTTWINSAKYSPIFDANNNLISELFQDWNGSAWVNNSLIEYSYDADNNQTEFSYKQWNSTLWENQQKSISTFDANHNTLKQIFQTGSGSTWQNSGQFNYTYDANNNMLTKTNQLWNGSGWDSQSSYGATHSYTYDANNNMLSNILQYWDHGVMWFQQKELSTYDVNNNLVMNLVQSWDGQAWKDQANTQYSYDADNNLVGKVDHKWSGSNWKNTFQYIYTYDAGDNQTSESFLIWDGSKWLNSWQYNFSYDENGIMLNNTYNELDQTGTEVVSGDSTHYYYRAVVTGIPDQNEANASVYPNPTKGRITISSNNSISSIEIYTLSGKLIFADFKVRQLSNEIDLSGNSKGIYFVKIYDGTKYFNRKVVLQ